MFDRRFREKAAQVFADRYHHEMNVTVLVINNDSVRTAIEVAGALGPKLWGVRLDTSEDLVDRSLFEEMGGFKPVGVNPRLVENVRNALDEAGYPDVRIDPASGGFTAERIREFESAGVPVDAYGVGSSLIRGDNDFTADVVCVNGRPCLKVEDVIRRILASRGLFAEASTKPSRRSRGLYSIPKK